MNYKINNNLKIVCIGGGLAIAAGDEKEVHTKGRNRKRWVVSKETVKGKEWGKEEVGNPTPKVSKEET